ncbi:50S ribosomal protein L24 [Spirochaeta africana]|uniref:Large ribosomal subunit protein uL24 n=1 Tax=Spirochaeta africana (strain ATCC 700263 / DSM 8902 / Z-7692) TaxID=889378 RepID=H9UGM3_SPIAZ|nr:50S ribosomal protein L24 [Spirochaeta africana]AFG36666.1 ribosomal protein L24, bacterial/organelle [Spirochaeta africana DSM 8902]
MIGKIKLKKNDQVKIISGKDSGKTGRVLSVDRIRGRVVVEGANLVKKTKRRRSEQDQGGIIEIEAPLHISNVMVVTKNGKTTRVAIQQKGDNKVRIAKKTGEEL